MGVLLGRGDWSTGMNMGSIHKSVTTSQGEGRERLPSPPQKEPPANALFPDSSTPELKIPEERECEEGILLRL
jgi:hypothetical protein